MKHYTHLLTFVMHLTDDRVELPVAERFMAIPLFQSKGFNAEFGGSPAHYVFIVAVRCSDRNLTKAIAAAEEFCDSENLMLAPVVQAAA